MSIAAQFLIKDAFERIGMSSETVGYQGMQTAIRSINICLSDWGNKNFNFWTLEQSMIALTPGVNSYALPKDMLKVIQCELRQSTRNNYSGFSEDSGSDAEHISRFAFDGNPITYYECDNADDRYIQYNYYDPLVIRNRNPTSINFLGLNAYNPAGVPWTISLEASDDFAVGSVVLLNRTTQIFPDNQIVWFELANFTPFAQYRIVQENTDGTQMAFREIYLNNNILDTTMSEISQYDYVQYPNKRQIGIPTVYYVNYQINPRLFLWQTPSPTYNCLYYSMQKYPQALVAVADNIDIPMNFYNALVLGLSSQLAQKYAIDKAEMFGSLYEQALNQAITKNRVSLPINFGLYGTGQ